MTPKRITKRVGLSGIPAQAEDRRMLKCSSCGKPVRELTVCPCGNLEISDETIRAAQAPAPAWLGRLINRTARELERDAERRESEGSDAL